MPASIVCLGAAHLDRKARAAERVVPGSSNPVTTTEMAGGVARNVAETLARLGHPVALVSRVGQDEAARQVLAGLAGAGVDTRLVACSAARPTGSYTALLEPTGELAVGLADLGIYDEISVPDMERILPDLVRFDAWFVDCNLPAATLHYLVQARPPHVALYVDAVSVTKSARLGGRLAGIDTLFVNRDEAAALARLAVRAPLDVCEAGYRLLAAGAGSAVVTMGEEGAFVASSYRYQFLPPVPAALKEVTGAGDALIAGFIFGRHRGLDAEQALRIGLACAALAIETTDSVPCDLDAATALGRAGMGEPELE